MVPHLLTNATPTCVADSMRCVAWYWNATWWLRRLCRQLSTLLWRFEGFLAGLYTVNGLLWLALV